MSAGVLVTLEPYRWLVVVASVLVSLLVLALVSGNESRTSGVRSRLLHGVPWGTALTVGFVASVYLFVQGGLAHPKQPLVIPFRSWSYYYPLGMVTAAFSHGSWSHLVGNLVGTVAYASIAEYAWGHYPRKRGAQTFSGWRTNPYARILAVPVVSIVVGLFTALFALGPVVGFSGVVFAYAGFAIVQRPVLATLAILGSQVLSLTFSAVTNPQSVASPTPRVVTPWWADIAIQGHAIGILAGILLAIALARSRDDWPEPRRVWFALVAFATFQGLWAMYLPADGGRYVLFRWAGVSVVFLLATVVVIAATRREDVAVPSLGSVHKTYALAFVVVLLASLSGSAVFYNVAPIDQQPGPDRTVEVRDYSVGYAEDIPEGYINAVSVPVIDYSPQVNTSGVIVTSPDRYIWRTAVGPARLENRGRVSVLVGGLSWRERVVVNRTGWTLAGNEEVYNVYLRPEGEDRTLGFSSAPATADPTIAGRNISIRPTDEQFEFVVSRRGETVGTAAVPANGTSVTAGGLTFRRDESRIFAIENETRVQIARRNGD
ncbi:Membrane associated serine protease, rhomboid family [Halomicrobium zhouii]|uniref:Membrane associated serine protease, rhomboid family n=1 Tax=Halomicrobium zhouii TaxID=767519 RepID=A0A1I6LT10_9EURY|nr:Membrane associated serine protease, rhomboid family [Halomicrobium zhouii]